MSIPAIGPNHSMPINGSQTATAPDSPNDGDADDPAPTEPAQPASPAPGTGAVIDTQA